MSETTAAPSQGRVSVDLALLAILALALLFRLYRIDTPLVDGHSWRQVTNADIARHFAQTTWNPLMPEVSWGGRNGVVGMEFPLLHYIIGLAWRIGGESERIARLITVAFSMASVGLIYALGCRLFSVAVGRGAAFLLAIAPSTVFFGRSVLSDTPMVTFSIAALLAWQRWLTTPSTGRLVSATLCTALAGLVKLPGVIIGLPIAVLAWRHRGPSMLRDRGVWIGGVMSVALIVAWYWHADAIAARTGLTQAVLRPSGVYGPEVGLDLSAYATVSHWSTAERLSAPGFYREMTDRFWSLHLTALGFAGALIGWWMARGQRHAIVLDAWLLSGVILLLASAEGQYAHQFHQLPLIPPLALYFGVAAAPLFDGSRVPGRSLRAVGIALCLAIVAVMAFRSSSVILQLYREDNLQLQFPYIGSEIRAHTEAGALLVSVDYETAGTNSPMLLFYAHRKGWSFDVHAVTAEVVERLRSRFGARYFVTMRWTPIERRKPELAKYLSGFKPMPLAGASSQMRMFDLGSPIGTPP
jgi:4-amino-4-deoxy-L-arabinose transferase-like glycosyltransferase